jgi:hypothetical protein
MHFRNPSSKEIMTGHLAVEDFYPFYAQTMYGGVSAGMKSD